jgi:uncharacterized membrane protein YjgN (DUF898 family)
MATRRMPPKLKPLLGTVRCGALAVAISLMGQGKPGKSTLPIWFLAAVMLIIFPLWFIGRSLGHHSLRNNLRGVSFRAEIEHWDEYFLHLLQLGLLEDVSART